MKVFNLTSHPLDFHGRVIGPNGGSLDYPELDSFLPSRDKKLEEQRILSFGFLPSWWVMEHAARPKVAHKRVTVKVEDSSTPADAASVRSFKDEKRKKYQG